MAGPSMQQTGQLVHATVALTMTDVKPDMALGMIMLRCAPGFFPGTTVFTNAGAAARQLVRDRSRLCSVVGDLQKEMVMLPTDYVQGANGTDRKPALYVTVRVVKFLPDREVMFVDLNKVEGRRHMAPYHPNTQPLNPDMRGNSLPIEGGAYCHYPDDTQQELGLYPWADHTNGPWAVVIGVGTMTHYTAAFCMQSLNPTMLSWRDYSYGNMNGHPHMKIPEELAELLSGEYTTVVMESSKTMIALYRMFRLRFLHAEHIHGRYGHEPGYMCKSWVTVDEHGLAVFLDQAMMPAELMTSEQLQFVHFPKSSVTSWGFDGRTHDQRMQSVFWQKKANAVAKRDKPNPYSAWFNPNSEASFMVHETGVSLSWLQVNHKLLCLRCTITSEGIDRVNQIRFDGCNVPGESQEEATNRLKGQMRTHLN